MSTRTKTTAPFHLEPLEDRQMFAAFGTMNVIDAGTGPSTVVTYTVNGVADVADAGVYKWTRSAVNPGTYAGHPSPGQNFDAFCLEPDQELPSLPNVAYTVVDLESAPPEGSGVGTMGAAKANQVRELWARFRAAVGTDNTKAAAFQIALWELVADTGKDLAGGAFKADTTTATGLAVKNQAQAWLDQVNGAGPKANLLALTSPCDQDQIFECPAKPPTTPLKPGMTATIGFWQNKNGQALIKSLNGGPTATNLGTWLATNFPNLWGAQAGPNNLAGKTNAQVAAFYLTKFNVKGQKLDAQILATAFATYVTNNTLAGAAAVKYGFKVDSLGTASATVNVGSSGAAFGVANNSTLTVWQILQATDRLSAGGSGASQFDPYNGNQSLRNLANTVFTLINERGDRA
jgi:hypothetical protein